MDKTTIIKIILFTILFILTALAYYFLHRDKEPKRKLLEFLVAVALEFLFVSALGAILEYGPSFINEYLEHGWQTEATEAATDTESVPEDTVVEVSPDEVPKPIYINEMPYEEKYGKLWTRSSEEQEYFTHTPDHYPDCLEDLTTPGHSAGPVRDNQGNVYTYGLHLDGADSDRFYIIYKLDGMYSTFSGTCAFPGDLLSPRWSYQYEKYFEIYGDGKLLYASPKMNEDRDPDSFSLNVTGIMELKIVYPDNHGPNEVATLFDGMLS